jgi:hypothetical protein
MKKKLREQFLHFNYTQTLYKACTASNIVWRILRQEKFYVNLKRCMDFVLGLSLTQRKHDSIKVGAVFNRSLGNLLRCLIGKNPRNWKNILPLAERTTNYSPFEVVYGKKPLKCS